MANSKAKKKPILDTVRNAGIALAAMGIVGAGEAKAQNIVPVIPVNLCTSTICETVTIGGGNGGAPWWLAVGPIVALSEDEGNLRGHTGNDAEDSQRIIRMLEEINASTDIDLSGATFESLSASEAAEAAAFAGNMELRARDGFFDVVREGFGHVQLRGRHLPERDFANYVDGENYVSSRSGYVTAPDGTMIFLNENENKLDSHAFTLSPTDFFTPVFSMRDNSSIETDVAYGRLTLTDGSVFYTSLGQVNNDSAVINQVTLPLSALEAAEPAPAPVELIPEAPICRAFDRVEVLLDKRMDHATGELIDGSYDDMHQAWVGYIGDERFVIGESNNLANSGPYDAALAMNTNFTLWNGSAAVETQLVRNADGSFSLSDDDMNALAAGCDEGAMQKMASNMALVSAEANQDIEDRNLALRAQQAEEASVAVQEAPAPAVEGAPAAPALEEGAPATPEATQGDTAVVNQANADCPENEGTFAKAGAFIDNLAEATQASPAGQFVQNNPWVAPAAGAAAGVGAALAFGELTAIAIVAVLSGVALLFGGLPAALLAAGGGAGIVSTWGGRRLLPGNRPTLG